MTTRPQRALETPVDTIARMQVELDELRSKLQGERYRRRWLYVHDVFNTSTKRLGIYYQGEAVFLQRELINDEPGIRGAVQGGAVVFSPGVASLRYVDEVTQNLLGEVFARAGGDIKVVGRDPSTLAELGALDIQELGSVWLTSRNDLHIDNAVHNLNGNIFINSDNNLDIDAESVIWIRSNSDTNIHADVGLFLRSNADSSDYAQIALYPNGEAEVWRNGDSKGSLVGFDDVDDRVVAHENAFPHKSFIIQHPDEPARYLVHGCTESPRAGVEYWGEATVTEGAATIELPSYFESLTTKEDRQVQLTPINELCMVAASEIIDGKFTIKCSGPDGTRVSWLVKAARVDAAGFPIEPLKSEITVRGQGPYRYISRE